MKSDTRIGSITTASLKLIAALVIALCLYLKFVTGGWLTLIPGLGLYPLLSVAHFYFHSQTLSRSESAPLSFFILIIASHVLFIGAFLLQYDVGDGPSWLTITALLHDGPGFESSQPPGWWPHFELSDTRMPGLILINLCPFVPTLITWILMRNRYWHKRMEARGSD